jgi:hypothetical protein
VGRQRKGGRRLVPAVFERRREKGVKSPGMRSSGGVADFVAAIVAADGGRTMVVPSPFCASGVV